MKSSLSFIRNNNWLAMTIAVVAGVFFVVGGVQAATTISTNVSTGGTLSVTGASTLTGLTSMIQASSTRFSVHDTAYFGGTATTTINSAGNVSVAGTLSVTGASTHTGLTSMIQASSTRFSVFDTAYFGGTATSTFSSTGALTLKADLTLQNDETISNSTDGTITLAATNLVFVGTASTSAIKVGDEANVSTINGLVFGYCVTGSITIPATNASSTQTYTNCTPSGGTSIINSGDRVFVQATSSLPYHVVIQSASSTASGGLINIGLTNFSTSTSPAAAIYSFNFWAVR